MHQILFRLGLRPRPRWGRLHSACPEPLGGRGLPTSKGGREKENRGLRKGRERWGRRNVEFPPSLSNLTTGKIRSRPRPNTEMYLWSALSQNAEISYCSGLGSPTTSSTQGFIQPPCMGGELPLKQSYSPWRRTINSPLFWRQLTRPLHANLLLQHETGGIHTTKKLNY